MKAHEKMSFHQGCNTVAALLARCGIMAAAGRLQPLTSTGAARHSRGKKCFSASTFGMSL